jgi:hypothetical protein
MNKMIHLDDLKNKTGFTVPEDFFEQNKSEILRQVIFEEKKPKSKLPWLSLAASLTIVAGAFVLWQINQQTENKKFEQEVTDYLTMQSSAYYDLVDDDQLNAQDFPVSDDIYELSDEDLDQLITTNPAYIIN